MTHKKEKSEKFRVLNCWMFSFEAWSRLLYLECLSWRPRNRYIPIYKLKHKRFLYFNFKKISTTLAAKTLSTLFTKCTTIILCVGYFYKCFLHFQVCPLCISTSISVLTAPLM
jgi:hypothetical protein